MKAIRQKAIRQYQFGAADVLRCEDAPDPEPGAGQVRIAVEAAGVHGGDTAIRGAAGPFPVPDLPMTPGREVAGTVETLGPGTGHAWLGRRVVAHPGPVNGGYAGMAVVAADALHDVPENLDAAAAVAMIALENRETAGKVVLVA